MSEGLLSGIRVLDAATLAAAPLAATYLGEFGAEVIKVEQPQGGDPIRAWGTQKNGTSLVWKSVSRNKKSITLDLRLPEGQDLFRRLAAQSDVVVVNNRPATLCRWGLDYENLHSVNGQLVVLHITGFGLSGPKSDRPGFGTLGEAMSGFAHLTGEADRPPTLPRFPLADGVASLTAAYSVMMALYHRDVHGGKGQLIDINLIDPLSRLLEHALLAYDQSGIVPTRGGNRWDISAPRNTYKTKDGRWIALSASAPSTAMRVFRAIGRPDMADDPDFAGPQGRLRLADKIDAAVASWVATQSFEGTMAAFEQHEVAAAPVYDVAELLMDDQMLARQVFRWVPDSDVGELRVQSPVPRFSTASGRVDFLGPRLGQHNEDIYCGLLQLSQEEVKRLERRSII